MLGLWLRPWFLIASARRAGLTGGGHGEAVSLNRPLVGPPIEALETFGLHAAFWDFSQDFPSPAGIIVNSHQM
jgi:hypothetical protein